MSSHSSSPDFGYFGLRGDTYYTPVELQICSLQENSKQKRVTKTSRKVKNVINHTDILSPGLKTIDETSNLNTSIEDHQRVSEADLCMTFQSQLH